MPSRRASRFRGAFSWTPSDPSHAPSTMRVSPTASPTSRRSSLFPSFRRPSFAPTEAHIQSRDSYASSETHNTRRPSFVFEQAPCYHGDPQTSPLPRYRNANPYARPDTAATDYGDMLSDFNAYNLAYLSNPQPSTDDIPRVTTTTPSASRSAANHPTLRIAPSWIPRVTAVLNTHPSDPAHAKAIKKLPWTMHLNGPIRRALFKDTPFCPLHAGITPGYMLYLATLVSAELHDHLERLLAASFPLDPCTQSLIRALEPYRLRFHPAALVGLNAPCAVCVLGELWRDEGAKGALGVLARGRKKRRRPFAEVVRFVGEGVDARGVVERGWRRGAVLAVLGDRKRARYGEGGGGGEVREMGRRMMQEEEEEERGEWDEYHGYGQYENGSQDFYGGEYEIPADEQNPFESPEDRERFDEGFDDDAEEFEERGDEDNFNDNLDQDLREYVDKAEYETIDESFYANDADDADDANKATENKKANEAAEANTPGAADRLASEYQRILNVYGGNEDRDRRDNPFGW